MIKNIKPIFAFALLFSLVACGSPTQTTSNTPPADTQTTTETTPSPQATTEATLSTEGITFKEPVPNKVFGSFDAVNNNPKTTQTLDPTQPLVVSGWALSSDQTAVAESVIITYGDSNTVATTVPTNVDRPDVAKILKNPALTKSGWVAKIDPATLNLTGDQTKIRAWSYNSQTKEAYPLGNSFEIVRK